MAIKVKHEGNVTSRVMASAGGGKGRRQAEDGVRLTQIQSQADIAAQDRASRESMQAMGTAAHLASSALGRAPGIMSAPSGPSGLVRGGGRGGGSSFTSQPYDWRDEQPAPVRDTYTDRQRAEFNRLSEALVRAEQSGDFTPDEMKELRRQVTEAQLGIKPVKVMEKEPAFPEGQNIGQYWNLDDGTVVTRDNKGNVKKVTDGAKADGVSQSELFDKAYSIAKGEAAETGKPVDMNRVKTLMKEIGGVLSGNSADGGGGESEIPFSFAEQLFGFSDIIDGGEKLDLSGGAEPPAIPKADTSKKNWDGIVSRDGTPADKNDPAKKWRVL